ncbi:MAG: DUF4920 domain-containing protein [Cellvibrionaceae bacterium]|nr:DUF4920 domain-containing protein [Cellvibrionaceae bacterium]MCV6624671.1 DUF4920 domain-containing protein [Cellvibrionaceae bacterium]
MKKFLSTLALGLSLVAGAAIADQQFGSGAVMKDLIAVETVMANPEQYMGKTITVEGKVVDVCKKRGCWAELVTNEGGSSLKIKVKDGDMVFPLSARGKTAYATGELQKLNLDLAKTRAHLAHEAAEQKQSFDPASVTEGMVVYRLKPSGVTIKD